MLVMDWKTRQGTQKTQPAILDVYSSPSTVYLRKNIAQTTVKNADGTKVKVWQYDECQLTREEYEREPAAINEMAQLIEQAANSDATYAEILLGQADTTEQLDAQDEALADILLSIMSK